MDSVGSQFNLTGLATITNQMPEFMGNYSCVFRGDLEGRMVAIKVIKGMDNPDDTKRKVIRERTVWATISHANILPFLGYSDDLAFGPFGALISPWCTRGDTGRFLKDNGERMVLAQRMNLWKGIIAGVAYLHGHRPIIIHGDLKPGNVLIDDTGRPMLCDFGLARIFLEEGNTGLTTTSEHTGTSRYLAPELVAGEHSVHPTTASDVYALGCLGLEVIFLKIPYANRANNIRGQIIKDIKAGIPPALTVPNEDWPSNRIWTILIDLWDPDPEFRPRVTLVAQTLERTGFTLPIPVLRRIIEFAASTQSGAYWSVEWSERTGMLHNLSLVSRASWLITNPILYRDIRLSPYSIDRFEQLFYSLNNSCLKPLPINTSAPDGYGIHIRTILLGHSSDPQDQAAIFQSFRALLARSPSIHFVFIYDTSIGFGLPATAHSSVTIEFQMIPHSSMIDYISIFQEFSYLQRLIIRHYALDTPNIPLLAFKRLSLPYLIEINVRVAWGSSDDTSLFDSICTWSIPRLQFFTYTTPPLVRPGRSPPPEFFKTHGRKLRYLSAVIDDSRLLDILRKCDNLLSVYFSGCTMATICDFLKHPTLERIEFRIEEAFDGSRNMSRTDLDYSRLRDVRKLKANARENLPNLVEATFTFVPPLLYPRYPDFTVVSFSMTENHITMRNNSEDSKSYPSSW